jgi:DNA-binding SARP family transcriptional activator
LADGGGSDGGGVDRPLPFQSLLADLLPDWYDDWLTIERERMRQLSLRLLEARARRALAEGDAPTAIQVALTALSIDPLRESATRLVIEGHLAEGNRCDARRALDDYRERTGFDARLAPSPELGALVGGRRNNGLAALSAMPAMSAAMSAVPVGAVGGVQPYQAAEHRRGRDAELVP